MDRKRQSNPLCLLEFQYLVDQDFQQLFRLIEQYNQLQL